VNQEHGTSHKNKARITGHCTTGEAAGWNGVEMPYSSWSLDALGSLWPAWPPRLLQQPQQGWQPRKARWWQRSGPFEQASKRVDWFLSPQLLCGTTNRAMASENHTLR
jgi:hypothetical protein